MSTINTFRNKIKDNFTTVPNTIVNNSDLSWKAKGIFLYLASKSDVWQFYMTEIQNNATDGKTALQSGIKELEDTGYLVREKRHSDSGEFEGYNWILKENTDEHVNRQTENPSDGKPNRRETASHSNTKDTNTKNTNNNIPTLSEVQDYFADNGYSREAAKTMYNYYEASIEDEPNKQFWRDSRGNKVRSWKMKARSVWFKDENKRQKSSGISYGVI